MALHLFLPAKRLRPLLQLALLMAAPAFLFVGASSICPTTDCQPSTFDTAGMALAARGHTPFSDVLFRTITWAGSIIVLGPLAIAHAILLWTQLRSRQVLFLPVALAGAVLLAYATKIAIARERPEVTALIDMPADASFPSAHTLQATVFVMAYLLAPGRMPNWPRSWEISLGVILVALVAWSRLHLQVHYPSDILFALVASAIWVLALRQLSIWIPKP